MCGIAGVLSLAGGDFGATTAYLEKLRDTMSHRGPDGAGTWVAPDGRVGLAHRRLAIIDPGPEAAQPMAAAGGSLVVTFNGEIYNHAEIRAELEASGSRGWQTDHSDTEVILRAFERWGIDCVHRFRGMFAFALWDARDRTLWLVRDRVGVKPLYYASHHGRLVFASEIKALLADPEQPRAVDEVALFHFLSFLTSPGPSTMFAGIRKLEPGTWVRVGADGAVTTHRWWDPWDGVEPRPKITAGEAADLVRERLAEAVRYRKVADVPVGVFLSGGLDSSANAALFSQGEDTPVRTFTIGYVGDNASYRNELAFARRMAGEVGADHHELLLTGDDVADFLPAMVELQDEPIADPVCVPLHYVSKLARDSGVVVCQVGEGADELFLGYPNWPSLIRLQRRLDRSALRPAEALAARVAGSGGRGGFRAEWLRRAGAGQPVFWGGAEAFPDQEKRRLLSPRLRRDLAGRSSWEVIEPFHRQFRDRAWDPSPFHWMTYLDLRLRLPELLLMRVDKMSMGVGLECRVPFLDHLLIRDVLSLPSATKEGGGELKGVLKQAVAGLVPAEIVSRPKQGFGVPVEDLFPGRLGDLMRSELRSFCRQSDLLDPTAVERVLATSGRGSWYLFNLALWWKTFIR